MQDNEKKPGTDLVPQKEKFSVAMQTPKIQDLIKNTLIDPKRAARFTAQISSVVAMNPSLQECDAFTVINAALVGEALELAPSPQLGYFHIVPFQEKKWNPETRTREVVRVVATPIIGYKGYIQLAIRTGKYEDIDAIEVYENEFLGYDGFRRPQFAFFQKPEQFKGRKVIGYMAYFQLITGFHKTLFWTVEEMLEHADTYSAAFSATDYKRLQEGKIPASEMWKYSSHWYANFDDMAKKTMLRQILSKWGIMSVELQKAFEDDFGVRDEAGKITYPDNTPKIVDDIHKGAENEAGTTPIPTTPESPKDSEPQKEPDPKEPVKEPEPAPTLFTQNPGTPPATSKPNPFRK